MSDVSVLGLGQMGKVVAGLLMDAGRSVTVWNRTESRMAELVARGAGAAADPADAVAASAVSLLVLLDDDATRSLLASQSVAEKLRDRIVVNLGTSRPEAAREFEAIISEGGGRLLDAAIQAAPSQMGAPSTPIIISGDSDALATAKPLLDVLAGNLVQLGDAIDAAAFMDLATLSYVYGSYADFLHGARMAESVAIDVSSYGRLVQQISPSFGEFFAHEGSVIQSGDYTATESPLRISVSAVRRILSSSRSLRITDALPALLNGWFEAAESRGLADEELAALIKVLR